MQDVILMSFADVISFIYETEKLVETNSGFICKFEG